MFGGLGVEDLGEDPIYPSGFTGSHGKTQGTTPNGGGGVRRRPNETHDVRVLRAPQDHNLWKGVGFAIWGSCLEIDRLVRSHEERRCSNLGPTQSRISPNVL